MKYDFCGYATRCNVKCSDGRTIMKDAFRDDDGKTVPLVWNHDHSKASSVLGHGVLENRDDGVFVYASFNDTPEGQRAKELVRHGDITALSIFANKLKETAGRVMHGVIREVSLVMAGANPEATIDSYVAHSDGSVELDLSQGQFYSGMDGELYHSEDNDSNEDVKEEPDNGEELDTPTTKRTKKKRPGSADVSGRPNGLLDSPKMKIPMTPTRKKIRVKMIPKKAPRRKRKKRSVMLTEKRMAATRKLSATFWTHLPTSRR